MIKNHPYRSLLLRRAEYLLECARLGDSKDTAINAIMRHLSNYAAIGKDGGSGTIKRFNRKVSKRAYELLLEDPKGFETNLTVNEHPRPLKQTWEWLCDNADELTAEDVLDEFDTYAMVTILKEEDDMMTSNGLRSNGTVEERYKMAGIEIIVLPDTPKNITKS